MLLDAGASLTIVGHCERRDAQRESDDEVKAKAEAALSVGLDVILCVGESLDVRERGGAVETVAAQLDGSLPASSTARRSLRSPTNRSGPSAPAKYRRARKSRKCMRRSAPALRAATGPTGQVRILYGGSVKASNAADIFAIPDVDGALVGGASLKAADFIPIVAAAASG